MNNNSQYKTFVFFLVGTCLLIVGIAMILAWWKDVVSLFRGGIGVIFAVSGAAVLYVLSKESEK